MQRKLWRDKPGTNAMPRHYKPLVSATVMLASAFVAAAADSESPALTGFSASGAATERETEARFDAQINRDDLRTWLQQMSSEPNNVGTPKDKANAEFMLEKFKEWGWDAHIETFYVLYPKPKSHSLKMVAPTTFNAALSEPTLVEDKTSVHNDTALPPYNVYGADGDVTGELVYANYGMPDDYKELAQRGIDVKAKIIIVRYGGGWRGLKAKLAHEHGAIGCIIYSDPKDDGYAQGDVYPKGGWRPPQGVQRGSVLDWAVYPGDPLTPGVGATQDAPRLSVNEAKTIMKIPVMPISYADAQPLLAALTGPLAPAGWRGALPITYHLGPGAAMVHMMIESDWSLTPIYDVIATIRGSPSPDQWVVRGNHHDGWTYGAWDPLSGNIALMAEAKAIGALLKTGWKPKRTLVYASWDAEEPGLLGSTEWAESHADELQRKAVIYVNSDTNARGFLNARGSHTLQHLVNEVAAAITDPQTGVSVQKRLRARMQVDGFDAAADEHTKSAAKLAAAGADLPIEALGSGSDFTPFLQHLGIATLNLFYGGEDDDDGVYHSDYDTFDHYVRFGDPVFAYGVVEAETVGHTVLRMADADVLPLQFGEFADTIGGYVQELHKLADRKREHAEQLGQLLEQDAFKLATDPTRSVGAPGREDAVPYINFAPLDNALARIKKSAKAYDEAYKEATRDDLKLTPAQAAELNDLLQGMEHRLTDSQGLPGRDWFKHMIYAPGLLTGYAPKTIPGVREAIEQGQWAEADRFAKVVGAALDSFAAQLDRAAEILTVKPHT